jgi:DNA-binding protein
MRTTIQLNEEAEEIVRLYANSRDISVSKAISELVLQAVQPKVRIKSVDGVPAFDIPQGRTITDEEIHSAIAEEF